MLKDKAPLISLVLVFVLAQACDTNTVYKQYEEIPNKVWETNYQPEFDVDIEDTDQIYNINIHIRNASMYPYYNIWLFMHSTTPTGETSIDTVECKLADESGEWLGDGMGDIWDNKIPWKLNHSFPQKGKYTFRMEQGMRDKKLPGIMDVGISVEKVELE
ncbi:MAG: gliding motility lipoprotein GldH [Bacteroidales bacterium]